MHDRASLDDKMGLQLKALKARALRRWWPLWGHAAPAGCGGWFASCGFVVVVFFAWALLVGGLVV